VSRLSRKCGEPEKRSRYSDRLRTGRTRGRSSSPDRGKNFLHVTQTGPHSHPASYPMSTGGKAAWAWNWPFTSN
jgi:hypothetical protein